MRDARVQKVHTSRSTSGTGLDLSVIWGMRIGGGPRSSPFLISMQDSDGGTPHQFFSGASNFENRPSLELPSYLHGGHQHSPDWWWRQRISPISRDYRLWFSKSRVRRRGVGKVGTTCVSLLLASDRHRLVADALRAGVSDLREENATAMSQYVPT
jgi:hypothetical protein